MHRLAQCFIQIWIMFYCFHFALCANQTLESHRKLTSDISGNEAVNKVEPVKYNLDEWLTNLKPTKDKVYNITIIPILGLIVFLWLVCIRIFKWTREDSKFHERGCSYDITSYIIVTQEDKDFDDINFSSHIYDTVTSKYSLQDRIDMRMYDTVTSQASFLRQNSAWYNRRSPTPDRIRPEVQVIQERGRFKVTPVIENYVRLKNTNCKNVQYSPTDSENRCVGVNNNNFSESKNIDKPNRHRTSFKDDRKQSPSKSSIKQKVDSCVQVNLIHSKKKGLRSPNNSVTNEKSDKSIKRKLDITSGAQKDVNTSCNCEHQFKLDDNGRTILSTSAEVHAEPTCLSMADDREGEDDTLNVTETVNNHYINHTDDQTSVECRQERLGQQVHHRHNENSTSENSKCPKIGSKEQSLINRTLRDNSCCDVHHETDNKTPRNIDVPFIDEEQTKFHISHHHNHSLISDCI